MEEKQIIYSIRFHFDNDIVSIENDFKSLKKAHKKMKKLMKKKIISFETENYITIDEEELIQF